MYRNAIRLCYAKPVLVLRGGSITISVYPQPTQRNNLCYYLLPVQYTELTHKLRKFLVCRVLDCKFTEHPNIHRFLPLNRIFNQFLIRFLNKFLNRLLVLSCNLAKVSFKSRFFNLDMFQKVCWT